MTAAFAPGSIGRTEHEVYPSPTTKGLAAAEKIRPPHKHSSLPRFASRGPRRLRGLACSLRCARQPRER